MKKTIAVIGATGAVGREILEELSLVDAEFNVELYASPRSEGKKLAFKDTSLSVKVFRVDALKPGTIALMSAGGSFSKEHTPKLTARDIIVVDNSSAFRMQEGVPLIVPEVNAHQLSAFRCGVIANPNCSTIQMVVALKPLRDEFGLKRVHVSTYQAVSGAGQNGISELAAQVEARMRFEEAEPRVFPQSIAYNALPVVGQIDGEGHCEEELKMVFETRKILELPQLEVLAQTVRVSVFNGHSEAISVELEREVELAEVEAVFSKAAGLEYFPLGTPLSELPTPLRASGVGHVQLARVRLPHGYKKSHWIQMWCVADNLRKGAATNAVQILRELLSKGF